MSAILSTQDADDHHEHIEEAPQTAEVRLDKAEDPRQWSRVRKHLYTWIISIMPANLAYASSIYTAVIPSIMDGYDCSRVVATLGMTTFMIGFATGPLLFAPMSEMWGRKQVFRVTLGLVLAFTLGCALSPNIVALCIFRFLVGFFGAPTVTNAGGSVTDLWPPSHRSVPLAIFTAGSFIPPVLAPVVGGFIVEYASSSWSAMQWTWWSNLIFGGVVYVLIIFLPETYGPKLLRDKARRMASSSSPSSGHGTLVSSVPSSPSLTEYLIENLTRPWMMLCTEPIVFLFSLYMAFVFGILYLDFTAYPIVYHDTRGWSPGIAGLSFLGMALGMTIATILSPYVNTIHAYYVLKLGEKQQQQQSSPNNTNRSSATPPEARLPHLIILSWFIPLSLFWFGWTAAPPAHYLASIASGVPFGIGLIALFLGINSYLTDCYGPFAASALAATAVFRAAFGAVFPLFAQKLYAALGVHWAMTLLGALAVLLAPLPWAFYRFGPAIRRRSAYHVKTFE